MRTWVALFGVLGVGCYATHGPAEPTRDSGSPSMDAGPAARARDAAPDRAPTDAGPSVDGAPRGSDGDTPDAPGESPSDPCAPPPVDVLLLIDDSDSMADERGALAERMRALLLPLVAQVADVRVGVLGPGLRHPVLSGCEHNGDAALWRYVVPAREGCPYRFSPPWVDGRDLDPETFAAHVGCLAGRQSEGCFIEQPLEAALRALSPSREEFETGRGRGDLDNEGFLRPGSFLLLVVVSDEDDCSLRDVDALLDRPDGALPSCLDPSDPLLPVAHYVERLGALRSRPDRLGLIAITGAPLGVTPAADAASLEALLAHEALAVSRDDADPLGIAPACVSEDVRGYPAPRLVRLARELSPWSAVGSICAPDPAPLGAALAARIGALRAAPERCE